MQWSSVNRTGGQVTEEELSELYRRYAPLVHARARRMVGGDADDVVQEVFIRYLQSPPKQQNLVSWFYTVSTNICMDRFRYNARRHADWQTEVRKWASAAAGKPASELLEHKELCLKILAHADAKTQQVIMLVVFDEMTQEEAAGILGISRKTVNERLQRFVSAAQKMVSKWKS